MLDASLAWRSALVERLEVVSDLIVEVAGHLLPRDRVLHRLAVLSDDSEVLKPRGHAAAAPGQVRVLAFLAALARLPLDADVEGIGAQTLGRFALGRAAPAVAGHESLTLAEIAPLRPSRSSSSSSSRSFCGEIWSGRRPPVSAFDLR